MMLPNKGRFRWLTALALLSLAGCGTVTEPPATSGVQTPFPTDFYHQAGLKGEPVYRIRPDLSRVDAVVRRGGPLARYGHDHVIVAEQIEGYVVAPQNLAPHDWTLAIADLHIAVETLSVDPADGRARHHLDTEPDEEDIAGTRKNMLEKVLHAQNWPQMTIRIESVVGNLPHVEANVRINLHGTERQQTVPFQLQISASRLNASGSLVLRQSDFGIAPFSILGGGLRIEDPVELYFDVVADRFTK